jgi:hypothetical protein
MGHTLLTLGNRRASTRLAPKARLPSTRALSIVQAKVYLSPQTLVSISTDAKKDFNLNFGHVAKKFSIQLSENVPFYRALKWHQQGRLVRYSSSACFDVLLGDTIRILQTAVATSTAISFYTLTTALVT